jgi:DUF4097 and DUF4098 domain-containing protein YvlB
MFDCTGKTSLSTFNGNIDVTLPAAANVSIHASTVSGSVSSGFPLEVQRLGLFRGSGGRDLSLSTVNGSVHIRKAQ